MVKYICKTGVVFCHVCRVGVNDNPCIRCFGHGNIAPPVHRHHIGAGIYDTAAYKKHTAVFRQEEIHLLHDAAYALVLVHTEHRSAVFKMSRSSKHGVARMNVMTENTAVPFYAAAGPGITYGKVAGPHDRICEKQVSAKLLVVKTHKLSAPFGKKNRLKEAVFKHNAVHLS